ncbi:MAG: hypothetical protein ACREL5_02930 [Gemmatimonadales bacterium]
MKIRFAQATIPGVKGPQTVDFGAAFKARAMAAGEAPTGCLAPSAPGGRSGAGIAASPSRATAAPSSAPSRTATPSAAVEPAHGSPAAAGAHDAPPPFGEGDVVATKIDSVKVYADAADSSRVVTRVNRNDELVYLGDDRNGFAHVQGAGGEGWIRKLLLTKHP